MGTNICACPSSRDESKNINIEKNEAEIKENATKKQKYVPSAQDKRHYQDNLQKIMSIQSLFRGYLTRKRLGPEYRHL